MKDSPPLTPHASLKLDFLDETETADCLTRLPERHSDREKSWLYRTVIYLGIAFCLAMMLMAGAMGLSPDPYGPAVVQHAQFGELYRRAIIDPHEDCLEIRWETRDGEPKFRSMHCPSGAIRSSHCRLRNKSNCSRPKHAPHFAPS